MRSRSRGAGSSYPGQRIFNTIADLVENCGKSAPGTARRTGAAGRALEERLGAVLCSRTTRIWAADHQSLARMSAGG